MVAHHAAKARPEDKVAPVQIVEVRSDHGKQPAEVLLAPSLIGVELDLRLLGLDQRADLQPIFLVARDFPEQVGVTAELDFVRYLVRR